MCISFKPHKHFLPLAFLALASAANALDVPANVSVQVNDGTTINAGNLFIVANQNDPTSLQLATEYSAARHIPAANIVYVALPVQAEITVAQAAPLAAAVANASQAKGFVMAWSMPYRVGPNQSITSFVTMGAANPAQFAATCNVTTASSYYNAGPSIGWGSIFNESTLKPSMLLASSTSYSVIAGQTAKLVLDPRSALTPLLVSAYLAGARATVQAGVAADNRWYAGQAYYLKTSDANRSVRATDMQNAAISLAPYLTSSYLQQNSLVGKTDILIYQTGLATLDPTGGLTNSFLPGAMADTLTSYSGRLYDSGSQISALEFLRAGATASYGTVREPCNYTQKYPRSSVLAAHVLAGDTVLEAYWKSVQWPTEGLFIGEPLARPYARIKAGYSNGELMVQNVGGVNGYYDISYNNVVLAAGVLLKQNAAKTNIGAVAFDGTGELKAVLKSRVN